VKLCFKRQISFFRNTQH